MIRIDISKCTGCRRCETACAFYHSSKINNHLSRIKVLNLYDIGIDSPIVCQQCRERYCLKCSVNAISLGSHGQVIISPTICTLCGACEKNCPIGAIEIFDEIVYVCDLCGGNPKCIEACTEGAIFLDEKTKHPSFAEIKEEVRNLNPSEKRFNFVQKMGRELREKWRERLD